MTDDRLPQRPELRVSHADRDRVAEQLQIAAGDGRLTMDELDERLERALNARTGSELEVLVRDLPTAPGAVGSAPAEVKDLVSIDVTSGSAQRQGRWVVPRAMNLKARSGNIKIDLTEAIIAHPLLKIQADVRSGNITIVTRPGIEVLMDEVSVRSGNTKVRVPRSPTPAATYLRVEVSGSVG